MKQPFLAGRMPPVLYVSAWSFLCADADRVRFFDVSFCSWPQQTPSSSNTRDSATQGYHQMVNTETRLIIFFAATDGAALYSQDKQNWELTVAQIVSSLLQNSDLN